MNCPSIFAFIYVFTGFVNRFYELKNIAVGKSTFQSSTLYYAHQYFYPSYANDGSKKCIEPGKYLMSSTNSESNPYWGIDLERPAVVLNVTVKNRDDAVGMWINPFDIRVGHTTMNGGVNNPLCVAGATLPAEGGMKNFTCPEAEGRYVSIHLSRTQAIQLCEVEVYGIYL